MSAQILLKGTTWAHSRGYVPLVACCEAWSEFHPGVVVQWEKRSLQSFGVQPPEQLGQSYDLVVFDYPLTGDVSCSGLFVPLDELLPRSYLDQLGKNSVGPSYASYSYAGHQWGLPLDAACHVAAWRPDLLTALGAPIPQTWQDVLELAKTTRKVSAPLYPQGAWGAFLSMCAATGDPVCRNGRFVSTATGEWVLEELRRLTEICGGGALESSPVDALTRMVSTDEIAYIPLTYGYSNYCRGGYALHPVTFGAIPRTNDETPRGGTLGGAGLAVSALSANRQEALELAAWLASRECQRTLYVQSGGQPGHLEAWLDKTANRITGNFFQDTLRCVEEAYVRPNLPGFGDFQRAAGEAIHRFLRDGDRQVEVLQYCGELYSGLLSSAARRS